MRRYLKTDLACELYKSETLKFNKIQLFGYDAFETIRHKKNSDKIEKALTLCTGNLWKFNAKEQESAKEALKNLIVHLLFENTKCYKNILVVGLGNRHITADSLGPAVIDRMIPTGHIGEKYRSVYLIAPGVMGQTGLDAFEIINSMVKNFSIDCVIVIDSLSTASLERLATTIQLSSSGILPGSGSGNHRKEISQGTLGIPVFSIGVPLVISSSAVVSFSLLEAGISELNNELRLILDPLSELFVSPRDLDMILDTMAHTIAAALNESFGVENISPIT